MPQCDADSLTEDPFDITGVPKSPIPEKQTGSMSPDPEHSPFREGWYQGSCYCSSQSLLGSTCCCMCLQRESQVEIGAIVRKKGRQDWGGIESVGDCISRVLGPQPLTCPDGLGKRCSTWPLFPFAPPCRCRRQGPRTQLLPTSSLPPTSLTTTLNPATPVLLFPLLLIVLHQVVAFPLPAVLHLHQLGTQGTHSLPGFPGLVEQGQTTQWYHQFTKTQQCLQDCSQFILSGDLTDNLILAKYIKCKTSRSFLLPLPLFPLALLLSCLDREFKAEESHRELKE